MRFTLQEERNFQFRERMNCLHLENRVNPRLKPASGEISLSEGWTIFIDQSASPVVLNAAKDLQDYLFTSMQVSVLLKKTYQLLKLSNSERNCIILTDRVIHKTLGKGLSIARSYRMIVGEKNIVICGYDQRGAAQGVFHLEDLMSLREAPFLTKADIKREPIFSPRMSHSGWALNVYPDAYLNALAHSGMDSILLSIKGVDDTISSYVDFNDLITRASNYGLDVYFYSCIKSRKHPTDSKAEEYYEGIYGELFRKCPYAKGIVFVGESIEFPSQDPNSSGLLLGEVPVDGLPPSKPGPGWWPCTDYPLWLDVIKKTIRRHTPSADIVFWTYNWGWAPEKDRIKLINAMPLDITLMVTFEMFEPIRRGDVTHVCCDYTISFPGPGRYFSSEARAAKKRGIKLYTISNTGGQTWDFGVVPYLPVPLQWDRRCQALLESNQKWGLTGLMESHSYGWYPSFVSEMVKEQYWAPSVDANVILMKIARRDFGDSYKEALDAWGLWSKAMTYYIPANEDQYGPFRVGPSYPFIFQPDISKTFDRRDLPLPAASFAHAGSAIVKTFYHPYEDPRQSPGPMRLNIEIKSLIKMREIWRRGNTSLESAVLKLTGNKRASSERMLLLGMFIEHSLTTAINIKNWFRLCQKLMAEHRVSHAHRILDDLALLAKSELQNAEETIPIVERDSRLGWEPVMEYMTDPGHLRWKVKQLNGVLNDEIPKYRSSLNLKANSRN